jgi:hypothetical protein
MKAPRLVGWAIQSAGMKAVIAIATGLAVVSSKPTAAEARPGKSCARGCWSFTVQ